MKVRIRTTQEFVDLIEKMLAKLKDDYEQRQKYNGIWFDASKEGEYRRRLTDCLIRFKSELEKLMEEYPDSQ